MVSKKNKILLISSCGYSLKNKGDHAMLAGIFGWLKEHEPSSEIVLYANSPENIAPFVDATVRSSPENYLSQKTRFNRFRLYRKYKLVERISHIALGVWMMLNALAYCRLGRCRITDASCIAFFEDLRSAKVLILTGGGYLNSIWWLDGLYAKALTAIAASYCGIPVVLTSQGLGPIDHKLDRVIAKKLFECAAFIGIRDGNKSRKLIESLGSNKTLPVEQTGDDALLLKKVEGEELDQILINEGLVRRKRLMAINFRDASSYKEGYEKPDLQNIAELLDSIIEEHGFHLVFIPISYNQGDDDRESAKKIVTLMKHNIETTIIEKEYSPSELKGIVGECECATGISYHFLLFCLSSNVPAIGIYQNAYYRQKTEGLLDLFDISGYAFNYSQASNNRIANALRQMISTRSELIAKLDIVNNNMLSESHIQHSKMKKFILRGD